MSKTRIENERRRKAKLANALNRADEAEDSLDMAWSCLYHIVEGEFYPVLCKYRGTAEGQVITQWLDANAGKNGDWFMADRQDGGGEDADDMLGVVCFKDKSKAALFKMMFG